MITMEPVTAPGPGGTIARAAIADPGGNGLLLSTGHR